MYVGLLKQNVEFEQNHTNVNNCPTRCDYVQFIIFL